MIFIVSQMKINENPTLSADPIPAREPFMYGVISV